MCDLRPLRIRIIHLGVRFPTQQQIPVFLCRHLDPGTGRYVLKSQPGTAGQAMPRN